MRCLLIGNYGVGNFGDEMLRRYFPKRFQTIDWTVVSANPTYEELPRLPLGIRSLFGTPWWRTVAAIRRSHAVVFGGGTLLTDVESPKACVLWWWHARVARFFGKPVFFAFQGIGPFQTRIGEKFAKKALRLTNFLSVRDTASAGRAVAGGVSMKIVQTFDPVFPLFLGKIHVDRTLEVANKKRLEFLTSGALSRGGNVLIVIPRRNSGKSFRHALEKLQKENLFSRVIVASLQPDDPRELELCKEIGKMFSQSQQWPIRTIDDMVEVLDEGSMVLSQRYHATLAALALGKKIVAVRQAYDDKHALLPEMMDDRMKKMFKEEVERGEKALEEALNGLVS